MSKQGIFDKLLAQTEIRTGVGRKDILGCSKLKNIVVARKIFWCALRMAGFSTLYIAEKVSRNWSTVVTLTKRSPVEIRDNAAIVCTNTGVVPMDFSEWRKNKRKKYNLSNNPEEEKIKKVPDYKNNCVRIEEV